MPPAGQPRGCRVVRGVALEPVAFAPVAFAPVALEPVAFAPVAFAPVALEPVAFVPLAAFRGVVFVAATAALVAADLVAADLVAAVAFAEVALGGDAVVDLVAFAELAFVGVDFVGAFDGARFAAAGAGGFSLVGEPAARGGAGGSDCMPTGALTAFFAIGFGVCGARRGGSVIGARVAACHTLEKSAPNRRLGVGVGGTVWAGSLAPGASVAKSTLGSPIGSGSAIVGSVG